jgi:formylglycine-generating enzyme required for sulfatase activity
MKWVCLLSIAVILFAVSSVTADTFGTGINQFTIDFVTISNATNPADGYGIVNGDYRMGEYEIANYQWNKFKANLGVPVTGNPSDAYDRNAYWTGINQPNNDVSWYEAAQFVNWLNTSKGYQPAYKFTGTQGTSNYTFGIWQAGDNGYNPKNPYRNSNAYYFLPTENEWVKAAYWNGTNLQTYATVGNIAPLAGVDTNYNQAIGIQPWNVGSGSEELNGTYDMMGNLWEWVENPHNYDYLPGSLRGVRGGSYYYDDYYIKSDYRGGMSPNYESDGLAFRVASVPEPISVVLLSLGGLILRFRKN